MDAIKGDARVQAGSSAAFLRATVVCLTLATAAIHASLGGPLFTVNAVGYAALALALVLPGVFARGRWLTRVALLGFTLATILGWVAFGARFPLAYLDKAIEVVLVGFLALDIWFTDGGPIGVARQTRELVRSVVAWAAIRGSR